MAVPSILAFIPVPLRRRSDGWSPELQWRFIEMLAGGARPGEAARRLGKNRQNAYALRRRLGAESFAAAWDAAVAAARSDRTGDGPPSRTRAEPARRSSSLEAGAIGNRGYDEVARAAARSPRAREALALLEALASKNDKGDSAGAGPFSSGGLHVPHLPTGSVSFRAPGLRRGPC